MSSLLTILRTFSVCAAAGLLAGCVSTGAKTSCTSSMGGAQQNVESLKLLNAKLYAATLPSGERALLTVGDHFPAETGGDGSADILIPWSEDSSGKGAHLVFSKGTIGTPTLVKVTCAHFDSCRVKAYDPLGNLIDSKKHILGQDRAKTFTFKAPTVGIKRIEFEGSQIVLTELCVTAAGD